MKKTLAMLGFIGSTLTLGACTPVTHDDIKEIGPNETAFLIQLDGNSMDNQNRFQSEDFLEKNRIATKRVIIPHKLIDTCHNCWTHEWQEVSVAKLIVINRAPVTREWTSTNSTGTSAHNEAFNVESSESIDFSIGAVMTAHIAENDAAKFLYNFGGKQLEEVADENVRGFIASDLSQQFGSNVLDYDRTHKVDVFNKAFADAKTYFANKGVTIDNLGFTEGMTYHDANIQRAINQKFEADMQAEIAQKTLEAAKITAEAKDAVKAQQDLELKRRELDIEMTKVQKWDGHNSLYSGLPGMNVNVSPNASH
jgi:hypothetical protein